jgi:hypothetical protein
MSDQPCKCMNNHASVAPTHDGHCCFWPPDADCHPAEFAAWVEEHKRRHPGWEPS